MLCSPSDMINRFLGGTHMDVYLSARRDLLVVRRGTPIPAVAAPGNWRKSKKKRIAKVSEEIRSALEAQGYYMRKLKDVYCRN
jgi:hypothetical protein